jgi:putative flippase GtrA
MKEGPGFAPAASREAGYLLRFLAVGLLNTGIGLGTIYASKYFLSLGDAPANFLGYGVGLVNSFFCNRRWTFSHAGKPFRAIARFLAAFAVAYAVNLATVLLLTRAGGMNAYLAHALAIAPYTVIFYLCCRYFVFAGACNGQESVSQ